MLDLLKNSENYTLTENGAVTLHTTGSDCLDLFASIGALRSASDEEIVTRFMRAYAEEPDLAVKTLFFARDIRGGLGERRVFRVVFRWLAEYEPSSCRRNIPLAGEYGRFDDLLCLFGTPCEADMVNYIRTQLEADLAAMESGHSLSLLAKWLPSVNASSPETVETAKKLARALKMSDAEYRKTLSALRGKLRILENDLREKAYTFAYEEQPSQALLKYRKAFLRNDEARYKKFLDHAKADPKAMHTGTLAPYEIIAPIYGRHMTFNNLSDDERQALDVTWNAQEDFTGGENALVVADGSGSMYTLGRPMPAAVAQSLAIYFAERNTGRFHNHFITFSETPRLVEIKGRDIADKVRYCASFCEVANTNLQRVFEMILGAAVNSRLSQDKMPTRLYIITDMEFDRCGRLRKTNFARAKKMFEEHGYQLPEVVFWNVQSRNRQQPVSKNEQGVVLVSGASKHVFELLRERQNDPYSAMMKILMSDRYRPVAA